MWPTRFFAYSLALSLAVTIGPHRDAQAQQTPPATKPASPPPAPPSKSDAQKGAEAQKPATTTKPTPPPSPPSPKSDAKADQTLAKALEQLDPKNLGWVEMAVWQRVNIGMVVQANGRYVSGPKQLLRVELTVDLGGSKGESLLVSDGTTVWNTFRVGTGKRTVSKWNLRKVQETLKTPGTMPQVEEDFYRVEAFAGVVPLLQGLQKQLTFTKQENATWKGHDVFKLTGEWIPAIAKALTQAANTWLPNMPRKCALYFDQKEPHWLYRVEWWGPNSPRAADSLLMEMEFRDPKRIEHDVKTFAFDLGKDQAEDVMDLTEDKIRRITLARTRPTNLQRAPGPQP